LGFQSLTFGNSAAAWAAAAHSVSCSIPEPHPLTWRRRYAEAVSERRLSPSAQPAVGGMVASVAVVPSWRRELHEDAPMLAPTRAGGRPLGTLVDVPAGVTIRLRGQMCDGDARRLRRLDPATGNHARRRRVCGLCGRPWPAPEDFHRDRRTRPPVTRARWGVRNRRL
jgi:hypothetical protein